MDSASGSNPVAGAETKTGSKKEDRAKEDRKASAVSEVEKNKKLEEELRDSKGEVQRHEESIRSLKAELEARNADVKKLKREKESNAREAAVKEKVSQGRQLDVAFLVHVDANEEIGKMKGYINLIMTTVDSMASESEKQGWKLRIAFAPYRDYKAHKSLKFDAVPCDFIHKTKPDNLLAKALSRFGANDRDDRLAPPGYFGGGFEEYLALFDWKATNRVVIHITRHGRASGHSLSNKYVKTELGGSLEIVNKAFQELHSLELLPLTKPLLLPITEYLPEEIDEQRLPIEKYGGLQCLSYFKHIWYPELADLITTIKGNKDLLYMTEREKVHVQIAKKPFKNDRRAVWPYRAKVTLPGEAPKPVVAYRFKTPVENSQYPASFTTDCHKADRYLARMEVHSVANRLAAAFNERIVDIQLQCPKVTTLSIDSGGTEEFYNVVEDSKGSAKLTDRHVDTLQAFTHWTHHVSGALLMVQVYPEGVYFRENSPAGCEYLCFEDPVIHCSDVMRFVTHMHIDIHTNLGSDGFKLFFASHKCNEVCKKLDFTPRS